MLYSENEKERSMIRNPRVNMRIYMKISRVSASFLSWGKVDMSSLRPFNCSIQKGKKPEKITFFSKFN